jgi:hypothetical protein
MAKKSCFDDFQNKPTNAGHVAAKSQHARSSRTLSKQATFLKFYAATLISFESTTVE